MITKKVKDWIIGISVIAVLVALVIIVYNHETNKKHVGWARQWGGPPETIEGLRAAIAQYEEQIERHVKDGAQTGIYWKILGMRLAERGMHRDALDAYERAIRFNTDDPVLFFRTGESALAVAASSLGFSPNFNEREHFMNLAESSFLRSVQLDSAYARPRLSLGILYTVHLDRPSEAIPHMERYLELAPNNVWGMSVLARAYYMAGNNSRAIEMYDRIITRTKDPQVKLEAQNNRDYIWNSM